MSTRASSGGPRIVVGYDGSEPARAAVRYAAARAGADGRVIVVLSVDSPAVSAAAGGPESLFEDRVSHGEAILDELLMEEAEALTDTEFDVGVARGGAAQAIVDTAVENDADEIAIGTRGAGRIGSLLGSVARDVLHRADRPVVVIPRGAVEAAAERRSARDSAGA